VQKNLPPGPGFRPHSRNDSSASKSKVKLWGKNFEYMLFKIIFQSLSDFGASANRDEEDDLNMDEMMGIQSKQGKLASVSDFYY
jgi:hypothetical protein